MKPIPPANTPENKRKLHPAMEPHKWKPGESGNRSGRPKRKPVTELYEEILDDPANIEIIRKAVIKALCKSNMAMVFLLKEMTERLEGKVTQAIEADLAVSLAGAIAAGRKRAAETIRNCQ